MSSLKMTFSLTSLIFLIALGLVFVPTSVMAHDAVPDVAGTAATLGAQHGTTDSPIQVPDNHLHPTVKIVVQDADS